MPAYNRNVRMELRNLYAPFGLNRLSQIYMVNRIPRYELACAIFSYHGTTLAVSQCLKLDSAPAAEKCEERVSDLRDINKPVDPMPPTPEP